MLNKKATKIINHFDLEPEITSVTGAFRYRYFDHLEQVEQDSRFIKDENLPDVPRYNIINWQGSKSIVFINMAGFEEELIHRMSYYFSADLQEGFTSLTTDSVEISQEMKNKVSDNSTQASRLDYLLTKIASSESTEEIEENISKLKSQMPVLDPTSKRPIVQTTIGNEIQAPDLIVSNEDLNAVLKFSRNSPFSSDKLSSQINNSLQISQQEAAKIVEVGTSRYLTHLSYVLQHPDLELPTIPRNNPDFLTTFELIGYSISKYLKKEDNTLSYQYTRFSRNRQYKDAYVAYGKSYRYEIRPVFARYVEPDNLDNEKVVFISSDESSFIDVTCVEEKAPSPPRNVSFEYIQGEKIKITWQRPESYVADISDRFGSSSPATSKLYDTNDIKGYQLFVRNSLQQPYRLLQYFTFNNTYPADARIRPPEIIPSELTMSSERVTSATEFPYPEFHEQKQYVTKIRPNIDYYFAMCSVDAHGNTSQYSSQNRVRRNNVTGEVDIEMVSQVGAPKQYPNLLIPSKLIRPSFTVSGFHYMDIYYAPDTNISKPSSNVPAVNIQLFELETQVEKNISITLTDKGTNKLSN